MAQISVGGGGGGVGGGLSSIGRSLPRAPAPKPKPKPPATVGGGLQSIARTVSPGVRPQPPSPGGDHQSSGPNYGGNQAAAYKQTAQYRQIVRQVFAAQPAQQKAAIISGLVRLSGGNPYNLPEYKAIRPQWEHIAIPEQLRIQSMIPKDLPAFIANPKSPSIVQEAEKGLTNAGRGLAGLIQQIPIAHTGAPNERIAEATTGFGPGQVGKNLLKDAVNLPAEVGPSVAIPIGQALSNNWKGALNTVASPFVQAFHHPLEMAAQHPLNTFLIAGGPLLGATRIADQGGRALLGKPAELTRPSIRVTGNLTKERPNLSKYPLIRHNQKAIEKQIYRPAEGGGVTPKAEGLRKSLVRGGVSQRVGMDERIRRVEVQLQRSAHEKSVLAPKPVRAAHSASTALRYNPEPALIPGAGVNALIVQGVIRRPETFVSDLTKHIQDVSAGRSDLLDFPKSALAEHDAYVKELTKVRDAAAKDPKVVTRYAKAFQAADKYSREYAPLQKQAHTFGHYGKDVTSEMLDRRALTPIVLTHMRGARFDPELQTVVRDLPHGKSEVLSTAAMRAFAQKETGGRPIAYVSHQRPRGDSAFYVQSHDFPAKAVQRNSMFAFQHGLTDPTHNAMLEARVHLQGVVSAHKSMARMLNLLAIKDKSGAYWKTYRDAKNAAGSGLRPVWVGRIHEYGTDVSPNDAVHATTLDQEAMLRSLDLGDRLRPTDAQGKWALIDKTAVDQLNKHKNQISPNALGRLGRASTTQFRKVALGTSAKHIPGVLQENMIRDIASGVFIHHWVAERNVFKAAEKINPELARQRRIELTGGQVAGATLALARRQVSRHFAGTPLEAPLRGFEKFMRVPGPRQLSYAWNQWTRFAINGTKRVLEESHQRAAVGKLLLNEFGGLMRLQGEAARQAAEKGYLPDRTARRLRAGTERMFGHWTDLTPEAQSALAVSPFGMWWVNSVRWLGRLPTDHPLGASVLAAANTGTEKERQRLGLDLFSPNHLPLYMQGGIPTQDGVVAQNYYSPFGVANDPLETAQSLILPTLTPQVFASVGDNWLGREMSSPQHPKGGETNPGTRARVILNSLLGMFIPLYQKAETIAEGGAGSYDTSTLLQPQTKGANAGIGAGATKAFKPFRTYSNPKNFVPGGGSGGASNGGWGGGSSSSAPSGGGNGGWGPSSGGGSSSGSNGGWG